MMTAGLMGHYMIRFLIMQAITKTIGVRTHEKVSYRAGENSDLNACVCDCLVHNARIPTGIHSPHPLNHNAGAVRMSL